VFPDNFVKLITTPQHQNNATTQEANEEVLDFLVQFYSHPHHFSFSISFQPPSSSSTTASPAKPNKKPLRPPNSPAVAAAAKAAENKQVINYTFRQNIRKADSGSMIIYSFPRHLKCYLLFRSLPPLPPW
jgi:hypothetical protein